MPDIRLFTKYQIKGHLFYIGFFLQIFAASCRNIVFYEVKKKKNMSGKECDVSKVAFEKEK